MLHLVVCPSHVLKGKPRSICSVNFFKGDRKLKLRSAHYIKNAEKRESGNSQRFYMRVQCRRLNLVLSLPLPETVSLQPVKVPDHGHDHAPGHPVVESLCMCLLPALPFTCWLGTIVHHAE